VDVVVAGGHGQVGLRLLRLLNQNGHRARGLIRRDDQAAALRSAGAEPVVVDLEAVSVPDLAIALNGAGAVVFAAGAGPGSGEERKRTMDYEGAVKLIDAARQLGIRRYVMVSAISAADPEGSGAEGVFLTYVQAKRDADDALRASGLDFTIVRPGRLTERAGTGRVAVAESLEHADIPRDDVAAVLLAVLADDGTIGRTFDVVAGDTPVEEAVASV
jgi:uncharacterized protein YbjT (DUF2867 family)